MMRAAGTPNILVQASGITTTAMLGLGGAPPDYGPVASGLQGAHEKPKEVLGAIAVLFAGVAWMAFGLVMSMESPSFYLRQGTGLLELAGMLVGLMGLRIRRAASYRRLGTTSFLVASLGIMYLLVLNENLLLGDTPGWMASAWIVCSAQLARFLGLVLLDVAALRARMLPR